VTEPTRPGDIGALRRRSGLTSLIVRTGDVLERQPLPAELWPATAAAAVRVRYRGLGYDGAGRSVSGSVFLPATAAPAAGWPVVSYAHGTTGLADHCAPSRVGLTRLEREHVERWLAAGYVVAATDYEGLATPGPHPYFNGEAVADDVIDAVRAARGLDERVGRRWLVAGFSQGGHAALFAGLLASGYAPELDFLGTVALAPPVHLPHLIRVLTEDGRRPVSLLLPFLLAGLRTSHPHLDGRVFLTEEGRRLVDVAGSSTLRDMFRAITGVTNDDAGLTNVYLRLDPVLDACRVPVTRMDRPVFVTAGTADDIVPVEVVDRFVADLRRAGAVVRYDRHDGATHIDMLHLGHDDVLAWAGAAPGFYALDTDRDGRLTRDDFEVVALRLAQSHGAAPGALATQAIRSEYRALWEDFLHRADTDADGTVSRAEFIRWIDAGGDLGPLTDAVRRLTGTADDPEHWLLTGAH
jgi:dienelactone hydrolase